MCYGYIMPWTRYKLAIIGWTSPDGAPVSVRLVDGPTVMLPWALCGVEPSDLYPSLTAARATAGEVERAYAGHRVRPVLDVQGVQEPTYDEWMEAHRGRRARMRLTTKVGDKLKRKRSSKEKQDRRWKAYRDGIAAAQKIQADQNERAVSS